jgi:hypothetical protein
MKKLFTHENRIIVFNLKNVLQAEGIETIVVNEFAAGGAGDLATFDTWPELWVEDDAKFERAQAIIQGILTSRVTTDWLCRACQEQNDAAFQYCWNCGRAIE